MYRESAKKLLPVIQAYAEGKTIQIQMSDGSWENAGNLDFSNEPSSYRIKPKEEYRPYESCDEMIEDFKERFNATAPDNAMPFLIWLKNKSTESILLVTGFDYDARPGIYIRDFWNSFEELFKEFTYLDGSPCGIKE